jgi:hypothetical protein
LETTISAVVALGLASAAFGGCSSSSNPTFTDTGTDAAAPPADPSASATSTAPVPIPDAGNGDAAVNVSGDAGAPLTCPASQTLDATTVPYLPPAVTAGACKESDITFLDGVVSGGTGGIQYGQVKTALQAHSATCAACVFAAATTKWAPIVEDGTNFTVNTGGCMEIVSGSTDCGKRWQQFDACTNYGCSACTTDKAKTDCYDVIATPTGACAAASTAVHSACGANLLDYVDTCFPSSDLTIAGPIRKQCIGP